MILDILFVLSIIVGGVLGYINVRLIRRLFQFDELFELLSEDIMTNLKAFDQMKKSALLENSTEVFEAHRNMQIMAVRLEEILLRMEELSNRKLVKRVVRPGPPPKVV